MIDYSHPVLLTARRFGQKLGILRPLVRTYRRLTDKKYEDLFDKTLLGEIKSGDVVWDVGANVGFYTGKFADKVGSAGRVIAFEPAPQTVETLRSAVSSYPQVTIVPAALSDYNGTVDFVIDDNNKNSGIAKKADGVNAISVPVYRGDDFARKTCPDIIKVDVEGFEVECVGGLAQTLADGRLRAVFIEVHFMAMAERGLTDGVAQLKDRLRQAGLSIRWIDPSHIVARRVPYTDDNALGKDPY